MYIDIEKSVGFFQQNSYNYISNYLSSQKIVDKNYYSFLKLNQGGFVVNNSIVIDGESFCLQCFLGKSNNTAYDIISCNKIRELNDTQLCAIAMLYGDDLICIDSQSGYIYYFNDEKLIKLAENFKDFFDKIKFHE